MEITYKHSGHSHGLKRYGWTLDMIIERNRNSRSITCKGCGVSVFDISYGCEGCKYWVCRSCYKLPPEMRHPFHKEHPLTLLFESPYEEGDSFCNACFEKCKGFMYNCSECKFKLDVKCTTLILTTKNHSGDEQRMFSHPHPLIPCNRDNKDVHFSCSLCHRRIPIKAIIYVCLDCPAFMDESCAQLITHQITHHFHPHPLSLQKCRSLSWPRPSCNACGDSRYMYGFNYSCSECEFKLDVRCASLKPKAIENQLTFTHPRVLLPSECEFKLDVRSASLKPEARKNQLTFSHPHVLFPCDTKRNFSFICSACAISIQDGTVCVCLECRLLLHQSCAQLPQFIKHPFHPPHPLLLRDNKYNRDRYSTFNCEACKWSVSRFNYWCAKCDFAIDVACASLSYSTFKLDQLHHHPLAFFNHNQTSYKNVCICGRYLGLPFFRCVPCDFTLNLCCLPTLPDTIKHSRHDRHSLTLTRSPVIDNSDDDEHSEYYCDLCEKQRKYHDPTYYCEECHYVTHLSCVFDEILPLLDRGWPLSGAQIEMLQTDVGVLTPKIETLKTKLDELNEKRAQHISNYQVGLVEMEIKNAFLSATIDVPAIAKVDDEIIMLQAMVDPLIVKLDELKEKRARLISDYHIGVMEVEIKNASTDKKTFLSATGDALDIAKVDEEIILLEAEIDEMTAKLETETKRLVQLNHIEGIPSFGTKLSLDVLDYDEVAEEDSSVESEEVEEDSNVKSEEDQESDDGTFTTLCEQGKALEAVKKKRAQLDTEIKLLNKKCAHLDKEIKALKEKGSRFISSHVPK